MTKIFLNPTEEVRILQGHSWVFNNEVQRMEGEIVSGDIVSVYSNQGLFLGTGFLNTFSKIFVRIVSREDVILDEKYFMNAIKEATNRRVEQGYVSHYRVLFGEADFVPGLIVDKYGDYLSIQVLSLGIEKRKEMFIKILVEIFHPLGIYERSDLEVRKKEGLELYKGCIYGSVPETVRIEEDGILLDVDIQNGQKTGLFLDQGTNHLLVKRYAKNKDVLDCFSHGGQFALHAKRAGAKTVEAVDLSKHACNQISHNASLNQLEIKVTQANVFDLLRDYNKSGKKFDLIILDPPAFTKSMSKLKEAYSGYKEINLQAMKLLRSGGILVSASCSHYLTPSLFFEMLEEAKVDSGVIAQMIDFRIQGSDHPTLLGSEETLYLKLAVLRIF
ncbi:MAG: class I SAM-dependent rRNA methyltransferase [Firmicutes bacterium]|nr:class I SAM-dependent rRNA methyltransferase [Bacillota bacterium]